VTEEFCVVLNHNGVLARDPSARIRTLFTDLAQSDVQDPLYLVCRIVRNGALKIGNNISSGVPPDARRGSEASTRADTTASSPGYGLAPETQAPETTHLSALVEHLQRMPPLTSGGLSAVRC
jgi:hypothetical protein